MTVIYIVGLLAAMWWINSVNDVDNPAPLLIRLIYALAWPVFVSVALVFIVVEFIEQFLYTNH